MIDVVLSGRCSRILKRALRAAGSKEIGGVLAAEQVGDGRFVVIDLSVQADGSNSHFQRDPAQHRKFIRGFHDRMGQRPERFNYLGEWHSHPSYPATPSDADIQQMQDLVEDEEQASTFLALVVVKLDEHDELRGSVHGFRPRLPPVRGRLSGEGDELVREDYEPVILVVTTGIRHDS